MKTYKLLLLFFLFQTVSSAQTISLTLERKIKSPGVYFPGDEDKAGYWKDYGNTEAFDFYPATNLLAAIIKESNGPSRLFIFNYSNGTIKNKVVVSNKTSLHFTVLKFSPDGKQIAIPLKDEKKVTIWDAATATMINTIQTDGEVSDLDWKADGSMIAIVAGKDIELWNLDPLERNRFIIGTRNSLEWPMTASWSPGGEYLAIGTNNPAIYIEKNGNQSARLEPVTKGAVYTAQWNVDGTLLATAGFGTNSNIAVWNNAKNAVDSPFEKRYEQTCTIEPMQGSWWNKLTWDTSGKILSCGDSNKNLFFWNTTGEVLKKIRPGNSNIIELHWKNKCLITLGAYPDKTFKIWHTEVTF